MHHEKNFLIQYNAAGTDKNPTSPLKVYPNPVRNILHIEAGAGINKVQLENMHGNRLIQKSSSGNTLNIDVSDLRSVIYILTITTNSYTGHRKIIVK